MQVVRVETVDKVETANTSVLVLGVGEALQKVMCTGAHCNVLRVQ